MAANNRNSLENQGEFHARVVPAQSEGHKWHKPGNEQGNDAASEYHAQTYPPGTAPPENTFRPNPIGADISQSSNPEAMHEEGQTAALDMSGSTSKDIHNSTDALHGRPLLGHTSREIRGAHPGKRKKERSGLAGVGVSPNDLPIDQASEPDRGMNTRGAESKPSVRAEEMPWAADKGPHGRTVK